MKIEKLMTTDVATVGRQDTLQDAVLLMERRGCGCLPVMDGDDLVGILTDRDVCLAAAKSDKPLARLFVEAAMTADVTTCRVGDDVLEAERRMGLRRVRRLPVLDAEGRLCGLLSLDDVARAACRGQDLFAPAVTASSVGRTLGQITRPPLLAAP